MALVEMATSYLANMAEAQLNAEGLFELGILYANGDGVDADLIAAHKWFNLAAMRGHAEAVYHRQQIAEAMSALEIAAAQQGIDIRERRFPFRLPGLTVFEEENA